VTKHLDVLQEVGLVEREARGRERVCRLKSDPLRVVDEWIGRYAAAWDQRLERLRAHVERPQNQGKAEPGSDKNP
jgi:DNA-binding transcriptional ArsR family regulator